MKSYTKSYPGNRKNIEVAIKANRALYGLHTQSEKFEMAHALEQPLKDFK